MADYICREAIIDDLEKEIEAGDVSLDEDVWINKGLRIAIRDIKDIKTADVQPLRHGRWLPSEACITIDCQVCSECRSIISMDSFYYDYCPVCGAKMDGEV